jgi:hypothetical protein
MKDKAILFGWVAGLLLLISMLWIFTQDLQAYYLLRTVNNVLVNRDDTRRLAEHVKMKPGRSVPLGYWYSVHNSNDFMFVFSIFQDGILIPLGAVVSVNGIVREVIPLSAHAVQVFDNLPKSILQMYVKRIEESINVNQEGNI